MSVKWEKKKLDGRTVSVCQQGKDGFCVYACMLMAAHSLGAKGTGAIPTKEWISAQESLSLLKKCKGLDAEFLDSTNVTLSGGFDYGERALLLSYISAAKNKGHRVIALKCAQGKLWVCDPWPEVEIKPRSGADIEKYERNGAKLVLHKMSTIVVAASGKITKKVASKKFKFSAADMAY